MYGYFIPPVNLMGQGALAQLAPQVKTLGGTKALIVTDRPLVAAGIVGKVEALLAEAGVPFARFADVKPNPTTANVEAGLVLLKQEGCDIVIPVGGGSPIDCAKGIGLVATNGGRIQDYEGLDQSKKPMLPMIAVNTTAGTASEMTRFTIITDERRHVKMAIVDWHITPTVSINDPELMVSMPRDLTAATGMDALTHAVEAYVSTAATPVTDSAALAAIELIARYLPRAVANGEDLEAREQMAYAQFMAGMAFNNASLGYVHAMAHQLGGLYDLPHGVCNAVLLPHVCRFNLIARTDRFARVAAALGANVDGLAPLDAAEQAVQAILQLARAVGIPKGLRELGVKEADFPRLSENAMHDACMLTNPRKATLADVGAMFAAAF
ncbi:MAG: iron-containing alcohol dehydrogenase [Myxococcales bacterium]|nr:iron-containing alcohol dehydrogenase [Myxococcales bacterium]